MEKKVPLGNWFSRILDAIRAETSAEMRPYGVDNVGFAILYGMALIGDGKTQAELTEYLFIDNAATSRTLDALDRQGFIERRLNPGDKRKKLVFLTDAGREMEATVSDIYDRVFCDLTEGLAKKDVLSTLKILQSISENAIVMRQARVLAEAG
ncbi:MAG: MarR family transcriptional regulator [Coriobacteriales bacterium]|jgi:DNA-binding MarR family transcriptional regulator|nr:MarR family transcriptional regulator [Coriobacteriales bacterium]